MRENIYSHIYDKNMKAIMYVFSKFRQYLVGGKFIVKIDRNSLKHFLSQKYLNDKKWKWVSRIQSYDFYIEYKKGKINVVVDSLSMRPTISLMHVPNDWKSQLAIGYSKDKFACEVLDGLVHDDAFKVLNHVI